jgi:hypothetical protein
MERRIVPTMTEIEGWLTTGDAASRLGKTRQGIKFMLGEQRLRGVRTQLGWLIDPASIEEYEERRKKNG